jgi:hypothetical protein
MSFGILDLPRNFLFILDVGKSSRIHRLAIAMFFLIIRGRLTLTVDFSVCSSFDTSENKSVEKNSRLTSANWLPNHLNLVNIEVICTSL